LISMKVLFKKMSRENRNFYKKLIAIVVPVTVQNIMSSLVTASDSLMLGFLDQSSLSASSLAGQVTFVLNLFICSFVTGCTVMAAQYWGKGDKLAVEKILAIALRFNLLVCILFALSSLFIPELLMSIYTNDKELIEIGVPYLRIVAPSFIFTGISQTYLGIMKTSGQAIKSTIYGSVALVSNIILNAIFIFGLFGMPEMGIQGAAWATTIARLLELMLVVIENFRKEVIKVRFKFIFVASKVLTKDFIKYTGPVLANMLVWGVGFSSFSAILGRLGSEAVAANSIASIIKNLLVSMSYGIGTGSGIIVGNELGRGELELAKKYGGKLCKAAITMGFISAVLIICTIPFSHIFGMSLTPLAKTYLKGMLLVCAWYVTGEAINVTTITGIFCAGGDTKFGLICDTINMWGIIIPASLLAAFVFDLPVLAVYFIMNCNEMTKLPIVYKHYKKYRWIKNITVDNVD